ncbi:hypothetical protein AB0M89_28335 [Streptomyces microflavus]|uniref:hypothetical protein n=1 Tax=Streptomyces microflavus TaxID=1919 RepID=UPI0034376086
MTHPESDLPGRPAERAPDERPGGCADPAVGLLLTISEAVVLAVLLVWLGLRGLGVLITSVVDTRRVLNMAKTSGVVGAV